MLVSDVFEIPHEKLADWIALTGSALVYLILAVAVFGGLRLFVRKTGMRVVGDVVAALILVAGLAGYYETFVALDTVTFSHAVDAVLPHTGGDAQRKRLSSDRARGIREDGPADARRVGFYVLPVVSVAFGALIVATGRDRSVDRRRG
jgi:hypothetical protein